MPGIRQQRGCLPVSKTIPVVVADSESEAHCQCDQDACRQRRRHE